MFGFAQQIITHISRNSLSNNVSPIELQRKRKAEGSMDSHANDQTSNGSVTEADGSPTTKRIKTDEHGSGPLTNGTTHEEDPSHIPRSTKPDGKLATGSERTASHRQRQQKSNGNSLVSSNLGLGSAASTIVKKTKSELDSSFKPARADPEASSAYKSLFHSGEERPKEKQSHWVTFFPYH